MSATLAEPTIEIRSGVGYEVAEVNFPKRIVTVVAMPYEKATDLALVDGRHVTEVCSRGAFNGIEKRASRVKANRDHSWDKPVGKVVAFHPSRVEGLVAEVKISDTDLGRETLTLCDDRVLAASAGFALLRNENGRVYPDAEVWERNRKVRRLNRLHLDHISFVPNPAYDSALVLDVRRAEAAARRDEGGTPNRDQLVIDALRAQMAELDKRFLR